MRGATMLCASLVVPVLGLLSYGDQLRYASFFMSVSIGGSCTDRSLILGVIGIFPLHALYPLMKRWTWWPQAWLGKSSGGPPGSRD